MKQRVEICILAGGLSSRMGRDKAKLRFGRTTLLTHIRKTAKTTQLPVRVIRRDFVPRCGPLGGIYTALKTTSSEAILFLACDMPNVSGAFLEKLLQISKHGRESVFVWNEGVAGFPFVLNHDALSTVEKLLAEEKFSLQTLAQKLHAKKFRATGTFRSAVLNINTPDDWARLKKIFAEENSALGGSTCQLTA
jgi:molybdopterin-guanine dinucleotide biosynthesis protein A